jgi:ATP-dependent RNA helicase RhlE
MKQLRRGVHIVVGTPGRLLDLIGQKVLDLSCIEVLILDEADRMLDMGFIHDIRKIIRMVPKKRQTLFFSATYSKEIKALADTILHKPKLVEVARQNAAAENVGQSVFHVPKSRKCELLSHLIKDGDWNQVLVFTRTKHGANRLAKQLGNNGIMAAAIHGNKSQTARTLALAEFKACKVRVLVATDIASRGLDIDRLPHVVNYDMPHVAEDYVHRIGRTGRAGSSGEAISLVMDDEVKLLRAIEHLLKHTIPVNLIEGFSKPAKVPEKDEVAGVEAHRRRRRGGNKGAFRGGRPHEIKR